MKHATISTVFFCLAAMALATSLDAKPLKVFILAGQSNMEGHAQTRTFPAIAKDPETADIHQKMSTLHKERDEAIRNALTNEERFLFENGISNQGFHYHGSAKFFAQTGKAFAEALVDLKKP